MDVQQSSETDTTCIMNKYNFVKPVTVTVIYEEDEEKVKEININDTPDVLNQKVHKNAKHQSKPKQSNTENAKSETKDNYHMLLSLAKNMSNIVEAYHKYIQCLNRNGKEAVIFKYNYVHTKLRYYKQSFEVAYRLLLPHKTNKRIRQFLIQKVIELTKVKIDSKYVEGLYTDLIFWTERMKDKVLSQSKFDKPKDQNMSDNSKRKCNQDKISKEKKVTIFSAGPKGNELVLSIDAKYVGTISQKDESNKRKRIRDKKSKPDKKSSTSVKTPSSNKMNHPLQTDTQNNLYKHCVNQSNTLNNVTLSELDKPVITFKKSIPKLSGTKDANHLTKKLENVENSKIISSKHNRMVHENHIREQDTLSGDCNKNSSSFQALMDQMNSALYPQSSETIQRASLQSNQSNPLLYGTNVVTAHNNKRNYSTANQNQIHKMNQNIYPTQNTTSANMANYPTSMPLQYNSGTNYVPQRTNLHRSTNTVNEYINRNYEHSNFNNTLPGYYDNYYNTSVLDQRQIKQQYVPQTTISKNRGYIRPVTYNSRILPLNLAAYQDRPNWFNI